MEPESGCQRQWIYLPERPFSGPLVANRAAALVLSPRVLAEFWTRTDECRDDVHAADGFAGEAEFRPGQSATKSLRGSLRNCRWKIPMTRRAPRRRARAGMSSRSLPPWLCF